MPVASVSQKEYSKEEYRIKLNVEDYVFEIDGNDIYNAELTYSINSIDSVIYKDGKKVDNFVKPLITIDLDGTDKNGNDAYVSFNINSDVNYLNSLDGLNDITNLIHESDSFIKRPNEDKSNFLNFYLPKNNENDIYMNLSSLWIYKIKDNEFIMKLSVPNDLFTYFKIIFK